MRAACTRVADNAGILVRPHGYANSGRVKRVISGGASSPAGPPFARQFPANIPRVTEFLPRYGTVYGSAIGNVPRPRLAEAHASEPDLYYN